MKCEPHGLVSRRLHDELKVGDEVEIEAPNGTFVFNGEQDTVGFIFQFYNLIPSLTAHENFDCSANSNGGAWRRVKQALGRTEPSGERSVGRGRVVGQQLPFAIARLRARLAVGGRLLAMITRKTPETKVFIEWGWRAERYTEEEPAEAFRIAGFEDLQWLRFPWRYFWLNRANYIVVARSSNCSSLESNR